ncbi:YdeI/OmpD-associated family protein [Actinophytocola gossypii]|uniref:DUF1905 domain-containing protein n=1 Tax=Actinophytocola gossypii TaxID=2812003 RepID=A0ABT2JG15_9PSEU|nr:YdeI/OmpD-associated family protein [Actinophytocola gossypii]MCT2586807.1 DUF1905 domain-containing protein [Actinophytocola gossypii]
MKIRTTIVTAGGSTTGILVPDDVLDELGAGKRPRVQVTLEGYTYRNLVGKMGDDHMIPLSADHRKKAGVSAGDELEVDIVVDDAPLEVEVPEDFAAALAKEPAAKKFFESLTYSKKRQHVDPITSAKKPETRLRRIEKSVETLKAGKS